jgi:hypothetical protein
VCLCRMGAAAEIWLHALLSLSSAWLFIARGAVSCARMRRRVRGVVARAVVAAAVGSAAPCYACRRLRRVGDVQRPCTVT